MSVIIKAEEIGVFEVTAMSLGMAKKENRDGIKSRFLAMTLKDEESLGGDAVRDVMFEENLGAEYFDVIANYRKKDANGNDVRDTKGGYVIDLAAIRKADGDLEQRITKKLLRRVGGGIEEFKFDVPRYSNDIDGNRTKDAGGRDVVKSSIMVFTQMKQMIPNANGGFDKTYFKGMSPQEKGERLIQRFFKEPVVQIAAPTTTGNTTTPVINQAPEEETPF